MIEIEGTIEEIIFTNEINGYTVCNINTGKDNHVAVGYMPFINVGETIKASGKWVSHPEYGEQFKVELYEKVFPQTVEAIEKYLSSGIIKGIGPVTAARIVERFGSDTLDILGLKPQLLADIKGISHDKALKIGQAFEEQRGLKNVVMFLQSYGISPFCCVKIYRAFGEKAVEKVKENPYCLSEEIFGIGFKTADKIAMSMGVDPASNFRAASGIKYALLQAAADGHTYLIKTGLIEFVSSLLGTELPDIENVLISLVFDRSVVFEKVEGLDRVYLSSFHNAELGVSRKLAVLAGVRFDISNKEFESKLDEIQEKEGVILAEMQKYAVLEAVSCGLLVITGGPGTGKTTIIKSIIGVLMDAGLKILLAAPTGRAAKRMSEATGFEARTIHRLLETGYLGEGNELVFQKNEENMIDADVIIIDEMSMVDVILMNHLLKAVPNGSRLILVGDINQLPSVGAGNVLKDIIESGLAKTVRLTDIFRQAQQSMIIVNAHRINNGEMPHLNIKEKDFFLVTRIGADSIIKTVVDLCQRRLPETYSYDPMRQIQVLSPTRKGPTGVVNLNMQLQSVLNPAAKYKAEKLSREYTFREGDRVMQVKNNYNLRWVKYKQENIDGTGVFNGDLGIITRIAEDERLIEILFDDDKLAEYDFSSLEELEPAFAVTIHKSQGSEFPVVVMPVFSGPQILMTRNLLYTAVTRAREMVVLVGDEASLARMVENERETFRNSGLIDKLKKILLFADNK